MEKNLEKKSILEYIIDKKSTSDFTEQLDDLVELTKINELFRSDYMAWGLAEFDAEQRGKKADIWTEYEPSGGDRHRAGKGEAGGLMS